LILGFHVYVNEIFAVQEYYAVYIGN